MISHIMLGTNDLEKSAKFYDAFLGEMGASRAMENERFVAWSFGKDTAMFIVIKPHNGEAATGGNGTMVALNGTDTATVAKLYAKAIELGATDEGKPGDRTGNFHGAYFRDFDGNKINLFCYV